MMRRVVCRTLSEHCDVERNAFSHSTFQASCMHALTFRQRKASFVRVGQDRSGGIWDRWLCVPPAKRILHSIESETLPTKKRRRKKDEFDGGEVKRGNGDEEYWGAVRRDLAAEASRLGLGPTAVTHAAPSVCWNVCVDAFVSCTGLKRGEGGLG